MSDKGRFDLEKSRFKQRFPNLPQEQFQYLLKKEKPELYKTAVREGWLKVTPQYNNPNKKSTQPTKPKTAETDIAAQGGGKKPPSNNNKPTRNGGASPEEPKGNGGGQKQATPKPSTGGTVAQLNPYRIKPINQNDSFIKGLKPEDFKGYTNAIEHRLSNFYKDTPIGKYSEKDILEYVGKKYTDVTPAEWKRRAEALGYSLDDPRTRGLTPQQIKSIQGKELTLEDVKKLFSGGKNPTAEEIDKLYAGRGKTINPNDILGEGKKAVEGTAKATSKEGLLGKFGQLGQKGAQVGQKIINNPVVNNPVTRFGGKYVLPVLAAGNAVYTGGVTLGNWNKPGSDAVTRGMDMLGYFHPEARKQAQIRREANAPYGSYTSNSVNEPTETERTQIVNRYNAGQPQANMSEEDALKMNLYGTTNVTGDSVPVDNEGIFEDYTGSTGGAVGGDGAGTPPSQGLTEIGDSGNGGSNNNGGVSGGAPVGGSVTYQPSGILPASPEYYADEAYLANLPFVPSEYTQQSLDNLSNGYVKQADIYEKLNRAQQAYNDVVAAQTDPRYQGGLIPAAGYNVNPVLLQDAQSVDRVAQLFNTMYGENNQIGAVKNVLDNAQANYEVGIANQAGVPYADYKQAMLDRREQEILARAQDVKNQLEFQKNQTADLKERRELAQKQYEVDNTTYRELMKARLDHRAKMEELGMGYKTAVDTAMISGQYGNQRADIEGQYGNQRANIAGQYGLRGEQIQAQSNRDIALINNEAKRLIEATKQGDSTAYINAVSNLGTMLSGMSPQMVEAFLYGNPTIREAMFGKGVTPEQAMIMLGRYQNSGNQGIGFWNWLRGNN